MYFYIVDPQKLKQKEFERVQNILYSSLSEFRVSGEVVRSTGVRTIQQLVENAFAHEAKTIVAVGNEETLHDVINAIGKREIVVGFIPLEECEIGKIFGIKDIPQAVKTIAFRRIEEIDLGVVNDSLFLSNLRFGKNDAPIEIKFSADEKFQARQIISSCLIVNSRYNLNPSRIGNPTDGLLDILLLPEISKFTGFFKKRLIQRHYYEQIDLTSVLHVKKIEILEPAALPITIGDKIVAKTPAMISIQAKTLRLIVGKDRNFET